MESLIGASRASVEALLGAEAEPLEEAQLVEQLELLGEACVAQTCLMIFVRAKLASISELLVRNGISVLPSPLSFSPDPDRATPLCFTEMNVNPHDAQAIHRDIRIIRIVSSRRILPTVFKIA